MRLLAPNRFTPALTHPALGIPDFSATAMLWSSLILLGVICLFALYRRLRMERQHSRALAAQIDLLNHRRTIIFDFLHDLGEAFTEGIDLDELLRMIASFSVNTTQASAGAVFLFDREKSRLKAEVIIGPFPPPLPPPEGAETKLARHPRQLEEFIKSQFIPLGEGLIGEVAATGKPLLIQDGLKDPRLPQYQEPSLQTRTAIFIPLKFKDQVLGVMAVVNKQASEAAPYFNANDLFLLDSLADHAAISLHNTTLYTMQAEQEQLEHDLRVASEIQKLLLPDHAPALHNFDVVGQNIPARQVGGDYYDFLPLDDGRLGVVIADVSGKAIPGALVMALCRSAFRAQIGLDLSPAEVLRRVSQALLPDLREDMFITILYGILDGPKRSFTFVRAGHDPALWFHAQTRQVAVVRPHGTAVGLDRSGKMDQRLEESRLELTPGDILILYTDGITESLDSEDHEFGRERLSEVVQENAAGSAAQVCRAIFERMHDFTGGAPPHDDRTLITIKSV